MSLHDEDDAFLEDFKQKARVFEIVFYPRLKNTDALLGSGIAALHLFSFCRVSIGLTLKRKMRWKQLKIVHFAIKKQN